MWLFCECGYFSIVEKECRPGELQVRARAYEDIIALRKRCPTMGPIIVTPFADYAYRAIVQRRDLAIAMAGFVEEIDYDNFKDRIHEQHDHARNRAYLQVWNALWQWQNEIKRQIALFGPPETKRPKRNKKKGGKQ